MAETISTQDEHSARNRLTERHSEADNAPGPQSEQEQSSPHLASLLGAAGLKARGNATIRAAAMTQAQQIHGNRAVQRVVVQRAQEDYDEYGVKKPPLPAAARWAGAVAPSDVMNDPGVSTAEKVARGFGAAGAGVAGAMWDEFPLGPLKAFKEAGEWGEYQKERDEAEARSAEQSEGPNSSNYDDEPEEPNASYQPEEPNASYDDSPNASYDDEPNASYSDQDASYEEEDESY